MSGPPPERIALTRGKRVLFLTKDPEQIRRQLAGTLDLRMEDLKVGDLLDDINTDAMTPAWVCFRHRPEDLALDAYAGLIVDGKRLFPTRALLDGNFEVIVSGLRKGVGSSRETAVQAEKWSGIRIAIAASFAPIHARNNVNQGVLMAGHDVLVRLQKGEAVPLAAFMQGYDAITQTIVRSGGLFAFSKSFAEGKVAIPPTGTGPRPMTIAEKILAAHLAGVQEPGSEVPSSTHGVAPGRAHHELGSSVPGSVPGAVPPELGSSVPGSVPPGVSRGPAHHELGSSVPGSVPPGVSRGPAHHELGSSVPGSVPAAVPREPGSSVPGSVRYVRPGDSIVCKVDGGYSHEFTTAQVHEFLRQEHGEHYRIKDPAKFAVFEDHVIYADGVPAMAPYAAEIQTLRDMQRAFQRHTGVRDFSAKEGVSPGICHQVAREHIIDPGDFIQATDSHTCMGGGNNALAYGVGTTEYAALVHSGLTLVKVPESIRFVLTGRLKPGVTAKDLMLHILLQYAKPQKTLDRVLEFGGPGLAALSMDERATLANMATECTARTGICEGDEATVRWIVERRPGTDPAALRKRLVAPDPGAVYAGGVHTIDLGTLEPMVAHPGDPDHGIPSDPTNGAFVKDLGEVRIDIAYGGSCTAGKRDDLDMYAEVMKEARAAGRRVAPGVRFYIQFGSEDVARYAKERGYLDVFRDTGVEVIAPGCGACIGCGPGVSDRADQVTVSAINRNYKGRSGPGRLYLASPLTVAASAVAGRITAWRTGLFRREPVAVGR